VAEVKVFADLITTLQTGTFAISGGRNVRLLFGFGFINSHLSDEGACTKLERGSNSNAKATTTIDIAC
jgi:hypothetical protein